MVVRIANESEKANAKCCMCGANKVEFNAEDKGKIAGLMLTVHSSRSTVTGLALAENKEKLTAAGAVCENPTLQQLSVELLKMAEE